MLPEVGEERRRDDRRLGGRRQAARVGDQHPPIVGEFREDRRIGAGPDRLFLDAEVLDPEPEPTCIVVERRSDRGHDVIEAVGVGIELANDSHERVVLLGMVDRIETEHHRLLSERQTPETGLEPTGRADTAEHVDPRGDRVVAFGQRLVLVGGDAVASRGRTEPRFT